MKKVFVNVVRVEDAARMEKILNVCRVSMNDWDRTKVFELNGVNFIIYNIVCEPEIHETINSAIKGC